MDRVKEILQMPSDELKANVQVCLEHTCSIFLGDYTGLDLKEETYVKERLRYEEGEPEESDLEFKAIYDVFQSKMNSTQVIWHSLGPMKSHLSHTNLRSVILGLIQAFELSEIPPVIPALLEALITGRWKNFVLIAVGLMSPSGMKLDVLGQMIIYLIKEDFLGWCKREICEAKESPSFNLYANQAMEPLEKLLGEAPET